MFAVNTTLGYPCLLKRSWSWLFVPQANFGCAMIVDHLISFRYGDESFLGMFA